MLSDLATETDSKAFSDSPATFVTQTQAIRMLSQSVHAFAQKHNAFGLLSKTATISVVVTDQATREYALPDDFVALLEIETDPDNVIFDYEFFGDDIVVSKPHQAYTITLRYAHEMPMFNTSDVAIYDFGATTDYILSKGAIDRWVVLDSAVKVFEKQEKDPSSKIALRQDLEANLLQNLIDRDAFRPRYVRNDWGTEHRHDIRGPGLV